MNIHIMHDFVFIDKFMEKYLKFHLISNNKFFVIRKFDNEELKNVKSPLIIPIVLNRKTMKKILEENTNVEYIYFHNFPTNIFSLFKVIPKHIKLNWIFHGTEVYKFPLSQKILDKYSSSFYIKIHLKRKVFNIFPEKIKFFILLVYEKLSFIKLKKVLKRFDYFYHWNEHDFVYLINRFPGFNAQYVFFGYDLNWNKDLVINNNIKNERINNLMIHKNRKKIMIGHSATITLNHFSVLKYLSQLTDNDFEIICPLSYGGKDYVNLLKKYAKDNCIENFYAIDDFLPYEEYLTIISNVSVLIMNNVRTQGAGNIFIALVEGKKVYMNSKNTHYQMLIDLGFCVYSMDDFFRSSIKEILNPITNEFVEKNQRKIQEFMDEISLSYQKIP